jgi:hypothetical protein
MWKQASSEYSQLHLLFNAFPPPRDQAIPYRALIASAIKSNLSPLACNNRYSRSALHVLCSRLATVTPESYPDGGNVLHAVLHACFDESAVSGIGKLGVRADIHGETIFDIQESVRGSWLTTSHKLIRDAFSRMMGGLGHRAVLVELVEPRKQNNQNEHFLNSKQQKQELRANTKVAETASSSFGPISSSNAKGDPPARTDYRSLLLPPR